MGVRDWAGVGAVTPTSAAGQRVPEFRCARRPQTEADCGERVSTGVVGCSDVGVGSGQLSERELDADALGDCLFDDVGSSG